MFTESEATAIARRFESVFQVDRSQQKSVEVGIASLMELDRDLLKKLVTPVRTDGLSVRSANTVMNEHLVCIGDLAVETDESLLRIPNFGKISIAEVKEKILKPVGLQIGMTIDGWPRRTSSSNEYGFPIIDPLHDVVIERVTAQLAKLDAAAKPNLAESVSKALYPATARERLAHQNLPPSLRPVAPIETAATRLEMLRRPPSMRVPGLGRK